MSAVFGVLLLISCLQTGAVKVEVPPPQNVTMITLNTQYRLSWDWDWDQSAARNRSVTFTTQYLAMYKYDLLKLGNNKNTNMKWSKACQKTPDTHCDLTRCKLHYLGIYMIRVQAQVDGRESEWVRMEFCPDKDAAIGPPTKVHLALAGSHLDVNFSDPVTSTNVSMRELLPEMYYIIIYWESSKQGSTRQMLDSYANQLTLSDLKAWTMYCVSVQSRYDYYNKSSVLTPPRCMQTEGATPWWQIFLYFLLSLVICFLLVLLPLYGMFRCYRTLKAILFPSAQLPQHLQEYLYDSSPSSDIPRLLSPESEEALVCDEVYPQAVLLEIHYPLPTEELDPDDSGRHSRQDSGGSRDSGVYSTEGGSGQQQPRSGQTSAGVEDSWQMHDLDLKVKSHRLIADEGVVDMSV